MATKHPFNVYVEDRFYSGANSLEEALTTADAIPWALVEDGSDIFCEDQRTGNCFVYTSLPQCPSQWEMIVECQLCHQTAIIQRLPDGTGFGPVCGRNHP
jgi:hypothetical protein